MRQAVITVLLMAVLCAGLAVGCLATDGEDYAAYGGEELEDSQPEAMEEIVGEIHLSDLDEAGLLEKIIDYGKEQLSGVLQGALKSGAAILAIVLLCQVASALFDKEQQPDYVTIGGALAIAGTCMGNLRMFLGLGAEALHSLSDFSKVLLPTLATASAAAGAVGSASAKYAATALFSDLLITAADRLILPMIYGYVVLSVIQTAIQDERLSGLTGLVKWGASALMKVLVLSFTAYLTVSGVLAGASDTVATKVTKTAISSILPVVGGIISDAASSVIAGAALVRNAVGIFGVAAVLCICLMPFLHLCTHYLIFKATGSLCQMLGSSKLCGLVDHLGTAFGLMLALVGSSAVILFISVVSSMRVVTG